MSNFFCFTALHKDGATPEGAWLLMTGTVVTGSARPYSWPGLPNQSQNHFLEHSISLTLSTEETFTLDRFLTRGEFPEGHKVWVTEAGF